MTCLEETSKIGSSKKKKHFCLMCKQVYEEIEKMDCWEQWHSVCGKMGTGIDVTSRRVWNR